MSESLNLLRQMSVALQGSYRSLYEECHKFSNDTGISCSPGCGACCYKPSGIYVTVAEMLPMAFHLFDRHLVDESLIRLKSLAGSGLCFSYSHHPENVRQGSCQNYHYRPSICALFGSSMTRSKSGASVFLGCSEQKQRCADQVRVVEQDGDESHLRASQIARAALLQFQDLSMLQELPINDALLEALSKILLAVMLDVKPPEV